MLRILPILGRSPPRHGADSGPDHRCHPGGHLESGSRERTPASLAPMSEVLEGLNDLLQLDHDSVAGYEAARERLENAHHRLQIESFQRDHERHIRELNALILELGGTPRNEPHVTSPLREAIQRLSGAGGDRAILTAWRASELQASRRYDSYSRKALHWPSTAKLLVDQNALDEERHYRWVVDVLDRKRGRGLSAARLREKAAAGIDTVAAGLGRL